MKGIDEGESSARPDPRAVLCPEGPGSGRLVVWRSAWPRVHYCCPGLF